jgi:hypothetical protein
VIGLAVLRSLVQNDAQQRTIDLHVTEPPLREFGCKRSCRLRNRSDVGNRTFARNSVLFYTFRKTGYNVINPNKEIIPTWDGMHNGRGPVLGWALAQPVN